MISEEELLEQKIKLIERIGVYLEKSDQLPPVAARIFAHIMLSCKLGVTFESLVQDLGASKSTISTHLSTLEAKGKIEYYTVPGDRKRYYVPISNGFVKFIDEKINAYEAEIELHKDVMEYKKTANQYWKDTPGRNCNVEFNKNILIFLEESIASFQKLKKSITSK